MTGELARVRSFLRNSVDIIYEVDAHGRFLFVTPAATRILGYSERELIGLHFTELIRPDYRRRVRDHYIGQLESGIASTYCEFPCVAKDGREVWIGQHVHIVLTNEGDVAAFQAVARDISDRMALEDALSKARDAALDVARMKSEFLATMSHEIRTPMNGVLGMLGILLDTDLDDDQREIAETARCSAEALLTLLNDILDLSKIEARKLTFEKAEFELRETLELVIDLLAEAAHKKSIEVGCSIDADVPRAIRGDAGRLRQILLNLVGNAVKFTNAGGVVVRVSRIAEGDGKVTLLFNVTDTGIGIAPDAMARLFEPFVQLDTSATRRFGGTGLGLAISKQLVTMMNGEIGVDSEQGHGSTFWFTADFETGAVTAPEAAPDAPRVLIVDDNVSARNLMSLQLSAWNLPNDVAADSLTALRMLEKAAGEGQPYKVVLADLQMPDLDGLALARLIQARFPGTRVNIVSSSQPPTGASSLADKGVSIWLMKPLKQRQLQAAVFGQSPAPKAQAARPAPRAEGTARPARILIVEDNPVNQKVALRQLARLGYSADAVANGLEALYSLASISYDAVLMDCHMPEMDGYAATTAIRRSGSRVPIIALSASVQEEDRRRCFEAGMNDFLSKPAREEELARVLTRWTESARGGDVLSLEQLRQLGGNDEEFVRDVLATYVEQGDVLVAALEQCEDDAFVRTAHALNGSSRNVGAHRLAELCRAAELDGGARRKEHAAAIAAEYAAVRREATAAAVAC